MDGALIKAVQAKAELLLGEPLGENATAMAEMAVERAMAFCQREDVPREMEQAVAVVCASMARGETVKSLKRGDVSIAYLPEGPMEALRPFCRLGRLKKEG